MRYLIILFLVLSACAKNGSDGASGANGSNGTNGIDGANGINGKDGTNGTNGSNGTNGANGTDNHIVGYYSCLGSPATGSWSSVYLNYSIAIFNSGDIFVSLNVSGIGNTNVSRSVFYSSQQNGASDGSVTLAIDNFNIVTVSINAQDQLVVAFVGTIETITFTNTLTCNYQSF